MRSRLIVAACLLVVCPVFALRADLNGDGRVDLLDLAILASEWLMEETMSYPNQLKIEGDLTPAAAVKTGLVKTDGDPYPEWSAGNSVLGNEYWYLAWDSDEVAWRYRYYDALAAIFIWAGGTDPNDPTGDYTPVGDAMGTATVTAVDSSRVPAMDGADGLEGEAWSW